MSETPTLIKCPDCGQKYMCVHFCQKLPSPPTLPVLQYTCTKRELFAAMALQGLLSATPELKPEITYGDVVTEATKFADALIEILEAK